MLARILLFGRDASLLSARSSVLNRFGLPIFTANTLDEVQTIAASQPIAILALCHTVAMSERQRAVAAVHQYHPEALAMNVDSIKTRAGKSKRSVSPRITAVPPTIAAALPPAGTF